MREREGGQKKGSSERNGEKMDEIRYNTVKQRDFKAGEKKSRDGVSVKKRERRREAVFCHRQEVACDKSPG